MPATSSPCSCSLFVRLAPVALLLDDMSPQQPRITDLLTKTMGPPQVFKVVIWLNSSTFGSASFTLTFWYCGGRAANKADSSSGKPVGAPQERQTVSASKESAAQGLSHRNSFPIPFSTHEPPSRTTRTGAAPSRWGGGWRRQEFRELPQGARQANSP